MFKVTVSKRTNKKRRNSFDAAYEVAFKAQAKGVVFNIMDLGKVHGYVKQAVEAGTDLAAALDDAITLYRVS